MTKKVRTNYMKIVEKFKNQKGFTLLLAALVASIVLALATSIFGLVQKELTLSSLGRDSQYAFYTADTAAECALYWDVRYRYFGLIEPTGEVPTPVCGGRPICLDEYETDSCTRSGESGQEMSFRFEPNGLCADVFVTKTILGEAVRTIIHADGYSRACEFLDNSSRVLQRSVELQY